ncbi:NAD(P)H nitroreductase [Mycobacterium sp. MBM]|nr:NAD(P)H nitroreductase [Mycobacterium sp. MBM]
MPRTVVSSAVLEESLQLACRAPSFHNSQPWRWIDTGQALELHLDPTRMVQSDTSGRLTLLSCGAVLDHLRVAMRAAGWTTNVDYYPNPNDHKHLASLDFAAAPLVTEGHEQRAHAIRRRRTDRLAFAAPTGWDEFETTMRRAVGDAALADVLGDGARPELVRASALAEVDRRYDSAYHADLDWWTSSFDPAIGIPHSALVSSAEADRVGLGRQFPVTHHGDRRPGVHEDRAAIVVLSAHDDTRLDILRCGEALSAVLLDATMAGLASCTLTHLTELPASRAVVCALTGRELPQVLIRVGLAPAGEDSPPPTPRRPLREVFTADHRSRPD